MLKPAPSEGFRSIALGIFAIAFGVRLIHLFQIRPAPFFTLLMGDARSYDVWAQQIASGDWVGTEVFYQAPLYPYLLGVIYRLFGRDLLAVRLVQAFMGSVSCAIIGSAVARLLDKRAGLAAGLMLAFWAPAIFFDSLLQKSVLDVFFVCVTVWLVSRIDPARSRGWVALGLAVGGLALTRENALVFLPVLIAWALLQQRRLASLVMLLMGTALVMLPVAARNYRVSGGMYTTTSQFGPNFYIGNNAHADGTYASLRYGRGAPEHERQDATDLAERATGSRLSPGEVSSYWTARALQFIVAQPGAWLRLIGRKFALLCNATEMVDTESQETYAEWSWPLRLLAPLTHFGILAPLALFGALVVRPYGSRLGVLIALTGAYAASVLAFYVFGRYRYPLVPLLIVFASAAVARLSKLTRPHSKVGPIPVGVSVAFAILANWRIVPHDWMRAVTESNLGVALQSEDRYDEAIAHYQRAIALRPDYAPAVNNMGTAYRASGRLNDAMTAYRRALSIQPEFPDAQYNLANALLQSGSLDEAIDRFETALRTIPDSAAVHNNLGIALASKGRSDEATQEFQQALAIDAQSAIAHRNLGNLLAERGDTVGALDHLHRAVDADPSSGDAHYDLGTMLLQSGRTHDAVIEFRAAIALLPASAEAHNNLGIALGSQGRFDQAISEFKEALRLRPDFDDANRNLQMSRTAARSVPRRD